MKAHIADKTSNTCPSKETTDTIIRNHVWGAAGVGLIPLPLLDFAVLTVIQLNMLRKLAEFYHVPFRKDRVKNILSSLVGGAFPSAVSGILAASIAKTVPLIGQTAGAATMPLMAGAVTYSVGKVFVQHFASGGTFLTFDPEEVRAYYADMLKEGEAVVKSVSSPDIRPSGNMKGENDLPESGKPGEEEKAESPGSDDSPAEAKSGTDQGSSRTSFSDDDSPAAASEPGYTEESFSGPGGGYEMGASEDSIAEAGDSETGKPKRRKKKKK